MATLRHIRGRDRLLTSIRQRCERAVAGHSSVLLVEGAAGFGKTRILTAATEIAAELGVRAGYGSATAGDQAVPMSPFFAALFEGPQPLVNPGERGKLHYLPEQRYWPGQPGTRARGLRRGDHLNDHVACPQHRLLAVVELQRGLARGHQDVVDAVAARCSGADVRESLANLECARVVGAQFLNADFEIRAAFSLGASEIAIIA